MHAACAHGVVFEEDDALKLSERHEREGAEAALVPQTRPVWTADVWPIENGYAQASDKSFPARVAIPGGEECDWQLRLDAAQAEDEADSCEAICIVAAPVVRHELRAHVARVVAHDENYAGAHRRRLRIRRSRPRTGGVMR